MATIDLISGFEAIMPILRAIADSQQLSFGEAWRLVTFYKRYRNIDAFIDYVEEVPVENYPELLADAISLDKETSEILHIYNVSKAQLTSFDPKTVYKEHLEPMKSEYQSAQEKSAAAYKEYKSLDNSLDMAELHYSKEELPRMWKLHAEKKAAYDECSKRTKELFAVYDRERRRTAGLFNFNLSGLVMMAYTLDNLTKALIDDLQRLNGKEDGQ